MKKIFMLTAGLFACCLAQGQTPAGAGGISPEMFRQIKGGYEGSASDRALRNAIANNSIDDLAKSADALNGFDTHFSHEVPSKGITDQKKSGRCWLFTGQNVLRSQMMRDHDLPELMLSQNYNFFYDQLEKANLFLQGIIDTAKKPMDDKMVDWLFQNPLSDGGQFTGIADNFMKHGVVPAEVMKETASSESTSKISQLMKLKLREYGLELRKMAAAGAKPKALEAKKTEMLGTIYRMLVLSMGEPPAEFTWTRRDSKGNAVETKKYTPQSFYAEYAGNDLKNGYVMLMNDPTREYYRLYEIDLDRHAYDGKNWTYINLPVEEIKKMAIESIKDSTMMYFSCDVGKFLDRSRGVLDEEAFDYASLFGTEFPMSKADRIRTHASGSTHAMTLMAVDLDENGTPRKWKVENSWGDGPNKGHLIMTDKWFDDYMFRLVVEKKYVPENILAILDTKPILLPAWDPLFLPDE